MALVVQKSPESIDIAGSHLEKERLGEVLTGQHNSSFQLRRGLERYTAVADQGLPTNVLTFKNIDS